MKGMWKTSSLSSTMTIPTPRRITSTGSDARPAAPTRARPTPSSLQETCGRPGTWSGFWRKPGKPSIPSCFSWPTRGAEGEAAAVEECVTAAETPTTLTSCTRTSASAACDPAAGRTAAAAASAPPRPTGAAAGTTRTTATAPAPTSTRATATAGATAPTPEPSPPGEAAPRIRPANHRPSSARPPPPTPPLRGCRSR